MCKYPTVVNKRTSEYDVYIGRGSIWGNPFVIGKDGNRAEVVRKYTRYILTKENLINKILSLEGKRLGCFCHPKQCHGDILVGLFKLMYGKSNLQEIAQKLYTSLFEN